MLSTLHPAAMPRLDSSNSELFSVRLDRDRLSTHHILLQRAIHLPAADQSLLRLALEGRTFRDLSCIFRHSPGSLCRRVNRLLARLRHPVVAAICDFPADLPNLHRQVGIERFLLRRPIPRIAADLGQTIPEITAILTYLTAFAQPIQPKAAV
jgi:hypothetical protein